MSWKSLVSATASSLGEGTQPLRRAAWHARQGGLGQLRTHLRRRRLHTQAGTAAARESGGAVGGAQARTVTFDPFQPPHDWQRPFAGITAATILDDFTATALDYEWDQMPLERSRWREQLAQRRPDLLFVESAWHGNRDEWQYQLTGTSGVKPDLIALVAHCRERKIPTVFWNKEDPVHFDDFIDCARLFDHVFTTDSAKLPAYRAALGHDRVGVLTFAASAALHSPVRPRSGFHARDAAFGGMYFAHRYPQRREQMDLLLGGAADASARMERGLEIFSRYLGADERYQFPAPLDSRVVGSLDYPRMLTAYQAYKVFLNVNSVVDSPSMCARRIFEILSRGTRVVTTDSEAVRAYFPPEELPVARSRENAADLVRAAVRSPGYTDRAVRAAQRRIWDQHTYTHRIARVLTAALPERAGQFGEVCAPPLVSVVLCTNRREHLEEAVASVAAQVGVQVELLLVTHGFDLGGSGIAAADGFPHRLRILPAPSAWTLGRCLNEAVARASGDVVAKMDDDDWYGPHYLADQLAMLRVTQADVVGKQASYMHVGSADVTLLRFAEREHRFTDMVLGPTLMARRELMERVPFPEVSRGEDTGFLAAVAQAGGRIYATDRFNFCQRRGSHAHTWAVEDEHLLATGEIVSAGLWLRQIEV